MAIPTSNPLVPALELMEKLIITARTLNGLPGVRGSAGDDDNNVKLDMIAGLHGKGCVTATEILVLLRSGLADGALARWRSLYEIETISAFVAAQGPSTAERYRDHAAIKNWEAINSIAAFANVGNEILDHFKQQRDEVVQKYGTKFKYEHGWAADVVSLEKRNGPNRGDLEKAVGKENRSPLYKVASYQVHPMANAVIGLMGSGIQEIATPGIMAVSSLKDLTHTFINVCIAKEQQSNITNHIDELAAQVNEAFLLLP